MQTHSGVRARLLAGQGASLTGILQAIYLITKSSTVLVHEYADFASHIAYIQLPYIQRAVAEDTTRKLSCISKYEAYQQHPKLIHKKPFMPIRMSLQATAYQPASARRAPASA